MKARCNLIIAKKCYYYNIIATDDRKYQELCTVATIININNAPFLQ
jgi:hypothetical protein